jgi:hypothetical protein
MNDALRGAMRLMVETHIDAARDIDRSLEQAFGFAGARCDRIVNNV